MALWDERDAITPLTLVILSCGEAEERDKIGQAASPSNKENARGVVPRRPVITKVGDHGFFIGRHEDPVGLLGPQEQGRIFEAKRQIRWVSDADGIDRMATPGIVILDRPPEPSALVFIQQKSDRHRSRRLVSTHLLQFPV